MIESPQGVGMVRSPTGVGAVKSEKSHRRGHGSKSHVGMVASPTGVGMVASPTGVGRVKSPTGVGMFNNPPDLCIGVVPTGMGPLKLSVRTWCCLFFGWPLVGFQGVVQLPVGPSMEVMVFLVRSEQSSACACASLRVLRWPWNGKMS